jgi:2,5-furandicarboxylate decarboxylase 1
VLFHNVKNLHGRCPSFPLITNVAASRQRIALAVGSTAEKVALDYVKKEVNPVEPIVISRKEAPGKEIILKGNDIDLYEFPIVTHHEMDVGL